MSHAGHDRLTQVRAMLKACTNGKGEALPQYGERVAAIRAEIERLEGRYAPGEPEE